MPHIVRHCLIATKTALIEKYHRNPLSAVVHFLLLYMQGFLKGEPYKFIYLRKNSIGRVVDCFYLLACIGFKLKGKCKL